MKKKQPKKKKPLKATWDDSSDSEYEEQSNKEIANYVLMAIGDEVSSSLDVNLSFHDLFNECTIMSKMFNCLKKEHAFINNEF